MDYSIEAEEKLNGYSVICGIDEAGRGPLAGAVYAAAVILPDGFEHPLINDSKKLSEKKREELFDVICSNAVSYCIGTASEKEIDDINILRATFLAMKRAVDGLSPRPGLALVDGNSLPGTGIAEKCIIKGDSKCISIASASILAKVSRDRYMKKLAEDYPEYQFEKHKGYGTQLHYDMIKKYGISPVHRRSFLKNLDLK
ncbi:MAG: ribonuclease HII [Clostridiales bacterium]|nr:ribonuclease HII [Clostridiales bacterium]